MARTIKKAKGGVEDLLLGFGNEVQTRNGQSETVTFINADNLPFSGDNEEVVFIGEELRNLDGRVQDVHDRLATEIVDQAALMAADNQLQENINAEQNARIAADFTLDLRIDEEETARSLADTDLQNQLNILSSQLTGEYLTKFPNYQFTDIVFPWDLGGLEIDAPFLAEQISSLRIDLAYGGTNKDLGSIV